MPARRAANRAPLLLLVRHGQTPTTGKVLPGRARGLHLSEQGRAQAEAVAERLAVFPNIDAIYSSPLERARETAAPLARARGMAVRIDKGLLELDVGEWTGRELRAAQRDKQWKAIQRWPSGFQFPGGESFVAMQARMVDTLMKLRAAHPGGTIVVVSHADPIKAAAIDAAGAHLDFFQRLSISPCSVTAIAYFAGGPMVLTLNSMGSLAELAPS